MERWLVNRRGRAPRSIERLRMALDRLDLSGVHAVLEVGCGAGDAAAYLARHQHLHVHGLDVDPDQVRTARRRHGRHPLLHFEVGDVTALRYADATFDLVLAQNVLHHVPCWEQALAEVARVLRPGGLLVWQDLSIGAWLRPLLAPLAVRAGVYTVAEVRARLRAGGLQVRMHRGTSGPWPGLPLERHHMVWQKQRLPLPAA